MTAPGIETEKCPKCEQVVYDAEGFPAGKKGRLLMTSHSNHRYVAGVLTLMEKARKSCI